MPVDPDRGRRLVRAHGLLRLRSVEAVDRAEIVTELRKRGLDAFHVFEVDVPELLRVLGYRLRLP
jgi:hypothetical protein